MSHLKAITEERGLTCLVNLHQVEIAKKYATRIIGVKAGEIVFDGLPSELTQDVISHIYDTQDDEIEVMENEPFVVVEEGVYG